MTDPISDMLTRIRNALTARHDTVDIPHSKVKESIARILADEGFVKICEAVDVEGHPQIRLTLKYHSRQKDPGIAELKRISKPGRRVYRGHEGLLPVKNGMGIALVSTSQGILTDKRARELKVGGELLFTIW